MRARIFTNGRDETGRVKPRKPGEKNTEVKSRVMLEAPEQATDSLDLKVQEEVVQEEVEQAS